MDQDIQVRKVSVADLRALGGGRRKAQDGCEADDEGREARIAALAARQEQGVDLWTGKEIKKPMQRCPVCDAKFPEQHGKRFCSRKCRGKNVKREARGGRERQQQKPAVVVECKGCPRLFTRATHKHKYCSPRCQQMKAVRDGRARRLELSRDNRARKLEAEMGCKRCEYLTNQSKTHRRILCSPPCMENWRERMGGKLTLGQVPIQPQQAKQAVMMRMAALTRRLASAATTSSETSSA